jgi:hypothetical protein
MGPTGIRRQHLWDQIGDLNKGGFLIHRIPCSGNRKVETLWRSAQLQPSLWAINWLPEKA